MKRALRIVSLVLVVVLAAVPAVHAAESTTYGSLFFGSYGSWLEVQNNLRIDIWFDVVGKGIMDELGTCTIELQESTDGENWYRVETYYSEYNPEMICENTAGHMDSVSYYVGVSGRYYRAYVTFYAKNDAGIGKAMAYSDVLHIYW